DKVTAEGNKLTVTDKDKPAEKFKVKLSKTDIAGAELKGATIELKNGAGKVLETWVSDGTAHEFSLEAGDYLFHEVSAPKGYEIATDIRFTIGKDGKVTSTDVTVGGGEGNLIVMVDDYKAKDVVFSKVDLGGKELPGAKIQIFDEGNTKVAEWTSTDKEKVLQLKPGTYLFHEESAPEGYLAVTDIRFTVDKDGKVVVIEKAEGDKVTAEGNKLTVTDKDKPLAPGKTEKIKTNTPGTGDGLNAGWRIGSAIIALGAMVALGIGARKRRTISR
ncbi:MAG: SpaA isopeptide-forming pilin-related protein, partial [Anaerovoracaceae bacterium]